MKKHVGQGSDSLALYTLAYIACILHLSLNMRNMWSFQHFFLQNRHDLGEQMLRNVLMKIIAAIFDISQQQKKGERRLRERNRHPTPSPPSPPLYTQTMAGLINDYKLVMLSCRDKMFALKATNRVVNTALVCVIISLL